MRYGHVTGIDSSGKLSHLFNVPCHHAIFWRSNSLVISKANRKKLYRAKYMHLFLDLWKAAQMMASYILPITWA